jgi:Flp pilus assembly protein TadD
MMNSWGYSSFANPYYMASPIVAQQPAVVVQQPVVYDYSRPLDTMSQPPAQDVMNQASANLDSARAAFISGDYAQAMTLSDQAIQQTPNDPTLHEFRAFCLFAMGRYDEAAVPMYTVLSAGPGWDWTTLVSLYPSIDVYTQQLRALEAYCTANVNSVSGRFLLASLYLTQGNNDAAAAILKQVVALQPNDELSAQILSALTAPPQTEVAQGQPPDQVQAQAQPAQPAAAPTGVAPPPNQLPPVEAAPAQQPPGDTGAPAAPSLPTSPVPTKLVGAWVANPAKDVTITLSLDQQKGFNWKVTERGRSREFHGEATFDNDILALAPPDQPPMVGTVAWSDDAHFQFRALGAPPNDQGLKFGK